jgi:hypothetical protein
MTFTNNVDKWIVMAKWLASGRIFGVGIPLLQSGFLRDGNGFFTTLGYEFGSIFILMGLLMGINLYQTGLWVRVCFYSTQTRETVGFLNPTKPSAYCHFIL